MKQLLITYDELEKLIEKTYNIKNIKLMTYRSCEPDSEICERPDYVIGEVNNENG